MISQPFNDFFPPNVYSFISQRTVDFALKPSDQGLNEEQLEGLESILGMDCPPLFNIRQVHGDRVVFGTKESGVSLEGVEEADGILTDEAGLAIVVRTADCLPVFLYDPKHKAIGLLHCGWQSSQKQIARKAVHLMQKYYQTHAQDLLVGFGPALRSCHYEVEEEFLDYFPGDVEKRDDKYFLKLVRANKNQLLEEGVKESHISDCKICTICDPACYSFREEGDKAGRMLSLMMIKPE